GRHRPGHEQGRDAVGYVDARHLVKSMVVGPGVDLQDFVPVGSLDDIHARDVQAEALGRGHGDGREIFGHGAGGRNAARGDVGLPPSPPGDAVGGPDGFLAHHHDADVPARVGHETLQVDGGAPASQAGYYTVHGPGPGEERDAGAHGAPPRLVDYVRSDDGTGHMADGRRRPRRPDGVGVRHAVHAQGYAGQGFGLGLAPGGGPVDHGHPDGFKPFDDLQPVPRRQV